MNASNNRLAIQSILLQKARHIATLERLEKEIEVRDRARFLKLYCNFLFPQLNQNKLMKS